MRRISWRADTRAGPGFFSAAQILYLSRDGALRASSDIPARSPLTPAPARARSPLKGRQVFCSPISIYLLPINTVFIKQPVVARVTSSGPRISRQLLLVGAASLETPSRKSVLHPSEPGFLCAPLTQNLDCTLCHLIIRATPGLWISVFCVTFGLGVSQTGSSPWSRSAANCSRSTGRGRCFRPSDLLLQIYLSILYLPSRKV